MEIAPTLDRHGDKAPIVAVSPFAFNFEQAAAYSGVPATTLRDWAKAGRLPVATYGRGPYRARYVILREDLERVLTSMRDCSRGVEICEQGGPAR